MVTLLTLKQEVWGSNPGAAPPKFVAQTPPYPASRSQICLKGFFSVSVHVVPGKDSAVTSPPPPRKRLRRRKPARRYIKRFHTCKKNSALLEQNILSILQQCQLILYNYSLFSLWNRAFANFQSKQITTVLQINEEVITIFIVSKFGKAWVFKKRKLFVYVFFPVTVVGCELRGGKREEKKEKFGLGLTHSREDRGLWVGVFFSAFSNQTLTFPDSRILFLAVIACAKIMLFFHICL